MDDRCCGAMAGRLERLERENRRWRCAAAAAVVAAAALMVVAIGRPRAVEARQAASRGAEAQDPSPLVEEQLRLARRALEIIHQTEIRGAVVENPSTTVFVWSNRMLSAQIYLSLSGDEPKTQDAEVYLAMQACAPKPERLAAFADHAARMRHWEDRYRPLAGDGKLSRLDYLEIQSRRLQAETWLARERLRSEGGRTAKAP